MTHAGKEQSSSPALGTFDLPKSRVRFKWAGFGAMSGSKVWAWSLFILIVGIFIFTNLPSRNPTNSAPEEVHQANSEGLSSEDVVLNDETVKMTYPSLDMGQPKDIFDNDTNTLIRGREANPFVLDFEFPAPRPITGLVMEFGGMDFDLRVLVYGSESGQSTIYTGEYRQQPPIPHVELSFVNGPALVSRIFIEIKQFNPPEEAHIHVREVLFKE